MEKFKKQLIERILEFGIGRAIEWTLELIFSFLASGFLGHLLTVVFSGLKPYKWELIIVFASGGAFLCMNARRRVSRTTPYFSSLNSDFLVEEKILIYHYHTKNKMTYTRKLKIKALKDGRTTFYDRYVWTGKGNVNIRTANCNQVYRPTTRMNIWQLYEIQLERTLKKGEGTEFELIWELDDVADVAQPFLATTIHEPTNFLKMQVSLPRNLLHSHQAICEVRTHSAILKSVDSEEKHFEDKDGHAIIEWNKHKPKLLYHYELRWSL